MMNEQFILKILDYTLNNIDKVYRSEDWGVSVKLDKEHVEINVFTLSNPKIPNSPNETICNISVGGVTKRIDLTQKIYNLIMYKLEEIKEKYINHKINIISNIIDYKESKVLTSMDNLFDEN